MKKIVLLIVVIVFSGCTKDKVTEEIIQIPAITEVGANTFGCTIDGFLLIPRDGTPLHYNQNGVCLNKGTSMEGDYYNSDNSHSFRYMKIYNYRKRNKYYSIEFYIPNFPTMGIGTFDWGNDLYGNDIVVSIYYLDNQTNTHEFFKSENLSGKLVITKRDNINHIFSGIFSGKLKNLDGTKEIKITDGRFDYNLQTVNNHIYP